VRLYEAAISSGNREAITRVFPAASERQLREFEALKVDYGGDRYRLDVNVRDYRIDGPKARVECNCVSIGVDHRGRTLRKPRVETLNFEWTGRTWIRVR
jgi:hypothetical protein